MNENTVTVVCCLILCTLIGVTVTSMTSCQVAQNKQVNDYMTECVKTKSPLECSAGSAILQRKP